MNPLSESHSPDSLHSPDSPDSLIFFISDRKSHRFPDRRVALLKRRAGMAISQQSRTLQCRYPPARLRGQLAASHAALEIKLHHRSVGGADAIAVLSHVAFAAAMAAIAVLLPVLEHFCDGEFLFAPAEFLRKSRFATGHPAGIEAGVERKNRFADEGNGHLSKLHPHRPSRKALAFLAGHRISIRARHDLPPLSSYF